MFRLLEHYVSTQGEGPRVGRMTQFVRFAGCNLTCKLWPCDTPFAIDPKIYRREQRLVSVQELATSVRSRLEETGAKNICLTGGEPLIQPQGELSAFVSLLGRYDIHSVEMFTNGTVEIVSGLAQAVHFVMDWKLPGSGEDPDNPARIKNLDRLGVQDAIKFTIATQEDLALAHDLWAIHLMDHPAQVFVGPVWGVMSLQHIVEYIKTRKLPWRLNVQTHNYIYGAQVRGT